MKSYLIAAAALMLAGPVQAQVTESGDAGQTLGTAQNTSTGTGTAITSITGRIGALNDADLYRIYISSPGTFSATVSNVGNSNSGTASDLDTKIFLFSSTGQAIAANDDANGNTLLSALPQGNSRYANLSPGTYYLGIANSGNEPVNSANQLLFTQSNSAGTVDGPATGVNPATLSNFNSNQYETDPQYGTGGYRIALTGVTTGIAAAAPEPATWALMILGFGMVGYALRRRRVVFVAA